uniref:Uncharacterized protein n=1 Tax=Arundo donax TaxID=35708 RepID=A0A0A9A6R7_ARUDO
MYFSFQRSIVLRKLISKAVAALLNLKLIQVRQTTVMLHKYIKTLAQWMQQ